MTTMTVPDVLHSYAQRGLFRNFHPVTDKGDYGFVWLNSKQMHLQWKSGPKTIVFKDLAPDVPARGPLYRELRSFIKSRSDATLPAHRRVDPTEFELFCENRKSCVSIGIRVLSGSEEGAMRKLMAVTHEAFIFLNERWPNYMYDAFGSPLE